MRPGVGGRPPDPRRMHGVNVATNAQIAENSMLRDPALADEGRLKIEFAGRRMPVLQAIREEFERDRPLEGLRIGACLHVTTETANLCRTLIAGGAELSLCASNPLSTKDDVAAAIHADYGARVFASEPQIVVDDGADLTTTIHRERPELLENIIGGTEVTSTGVLRIRNMAAAGALRYPVVAVNDAATKHLFDNRYGTGQNTIDGILRASNVLLAGSVFVVVGYGWCGRGVAMRAHGMGARLVVVEVDPIKALEAVMDGYQVLPIGEAAKIGDIFVTVTGNRDAIRVEHMEAMKSGAVLANSGHFDIEIDLAGLKEVAVSERTMRPNLTEYELPGGKRVIVLADGRLVGQSAAEAHPAEVMDMTFATQSLTIEHVAKAARELEPKVYGVPHEIEDRVARHKLGSLGIRLDELTKEQQEYISDWTVGT